MEDVILPNLEELSIYQLRALGRQVGVCLPTTLKKQDLINKIRAIMSGAEMPYVKTTNKGRPAKDVIDIDFMKATEEAFMGLDSSYKTSLPDLASYETLKPKDYANYEESVEMGLIEISREGSGYLMTVPQTMNEPIYVKRTTVSELNLKSGDFLRATVIQDEKKNVAFVKDVISINGQKSKSSLQNYSFESEESLLEKTQIVNDDTNDNFKKLKNIVKTYLGDRVLLYTPEKKSVPYVMYDTISILSKNNAITDIVYLGLNVNAELATMLQSFEKVTLIASKFGDAQNYQKKLVELAFKHVDNISNIQSKNVVFVVQNLSEVISLFTDEKKTYFSDYCKKFFSKAKQTRNGSLTIAYNIVGDEVLLDEYETNENVLLKYLPYKCLTNCFIKYNLIESHRTEFFLTYAKDDFKERILSYLENGDYCLKHIELEKLIKTKSLDVDVSTLI